MVIELIYQRIVNHLSHDKTQLIGDSTLELVRCFLQCLGSESASQLVKVICDRAPAVHRSQQEITVTLFVDIIGSTIWSELESPVKLQVLNTCGSLVETTSATLIQEVNQKKNCTIQLEKSVVRCVEVFFIMEKNRSDSNQKNLGPDLEKLFAVLSLETRMKILLIVHQKK